MTTNQDYCRHCGQGASGQTYTSNTFQPELRDTQFLPPRPSNPNYRESVKYKTITEAQRSKMGVQIVNPSGVVENKKNYLMYADDGDEVEIVRRKKGINRDLNEDELLAMRKKWEEEKKQNLNKGLVSINQLSGSRRLTESGINYLPKPLNETKESEMYKQQRKDRIESLLRESKRNTAGKGYKTSTYQSYKKKGKAKKREILDEYREKPVITYFHPYTPARRYMNIDSNEFFVDDMGEVIRERREVQTEPVIRRKLEEEAQDYYEEEEEEQYGYEDLQNFDYTQLENHQCTSIVCKATQPLENNSKRIKVVHVPGPKVKKIITVKGKVIKNVTEEEKVEEPSRNKYTEQIKKTVTNDQSPIQ